MLKAFLSQYTASRKFGIQGSSPKYCTSAADHTDAADWEEEIVVGKKGS